MLKKTVRKLPRELTSYDLIKTLAVALMIADHIGYYFFPEQNWWRVVGRESLPIWMFLIGYARSRNVGPGLWLGVAALVVSDMLVGMTILPLSILASIIVVRILLDPFVEWMLRDRARFWLCNVALALMVYWTNISVEYGTLALLLAITGYLVRHQGSADPATRQRIRLHCTFVVIVYAFFEWFVFGFTQAQFIFMTAGLVCVMGMLESFKPVTYAKLTTRLPRPAVWALQFTGRHTLVIYVVHLLVFKAIAVEIEPARFHPGQFHWYSETGV